MTMRTRRAILGVLMGFMLMASPALADTIGPFPVITPDLVLVVEQGREIATLRSPGTDLAHWDAAVVPLPSVPDATHVDYAGLATTVGGDVYLAVNARVYHSYDEFGFHEAGNTVGFGVYRYDRVSHSWSPVIEEWDSGVNIGKLNDIDAEHLLVHAYGYDYDENFLDVTGWSVSNAAIWNPGTGHLDWSPAWTWGYSVLAPYNYGYMRTYNRGDQAFVEVNGYLVQQAWQYDGAAWLTWSGPPEADNIGYVWPVSPNEQWFGGNFGSGNWLAHRVGSSVTYSDLPGLCGLAWDPNSIQWTYTTTTDETPFIMITRVGYGWLDRNNVWRCRTVPNFPWDARFIVARGPGDVVFEGKYQNETDMRLYYDHNGALDVIDPPTGYEDYALRTAFWTR